MFEQTFVAARAETRKPWPLAASFALQTMFVAAVLAIPIFQTVRVAWNPPAPMVFMPVKPRVAEVVQRQITGKQTVSLRPVFRPNFTVPTRVPTTISDAGPEPLPFMPQSGAANYGNPLEGFGLSLEPQRAVTVRPAAPVVAAVSRSPLRVSVGVQAAKLIRQVKPLYPPLARTARMSGMVRLQAIIGVDGRIRNLQTISGHPLLLKAALDAVKEWQYEPTLLNGEPVEVITSIDVNFMLNQ